MTSVSPTVIVPSVGLVRPAIVSIVVDFHSPRADETDELAIFDLDVHVVDRDDVVVAFRDVI